MGRLADQTIKRADQRLEDERLRLGIRDLLEKLTRREAEVLTLRFGFDDSDEMTLREIGERLQLSRERVRRIEEGALAKLVVFLRAKGISSSAAA
jgi:RNA polymerase sigma factor (sigma-70 family)